MLYVRACGLAAVLCLCQAAHGAAIGFTANPTTNSSDWTTFIGGLGQSPNTNVNFNTHPAAPLIGNFYQGSDGVTLAFSGNDGSIETGTGAPSGSLTSPQSPGEGPMGLATYMRIGPTDFSLTVSFASPVYGAGVMTGDYYNPSFVNTMTLDAFTGPNATGTLLGSFGAAGFNFQLNNLYFMGVADTAATIGSIRLSGPGLLGDGIDIDTIYYSQVPEPDTLALLAMCGLPMLRRVGRTVRAGRSRTL